MNILLQATTQPTGARWTPGDVLYVVTGIIVAVSVTLIPAIKALLDSAKAKSIACAAQNHGNQLQEQNNQQAAQIADINRALPPKKDG